MEFMDYLKNRRSVRKYTGEPVSEENIKKIVQAGLLAPTGHNARSFEFIVVRNKETLNGMTGCRTGSARMLAGADCAIVVLGDEEKSSVWTEDCSIAMTNMHLMADSLGVGSCWIQGRLREASDGRTSEEYLRELLGFPEHMKLEAVLSLGMPDGHPKAHELEELEMDKIHLEKY